MENIRINHQEKQDWLKAFTEQFTVNDGKKQVIHGDFISIIDFIRTLRQEAKEEGRREGMSDEAINCYKHTEQARLEVIAEVEKYWETEHKNCGDDCQCHHALHGLILSLKTNSK